MNKAFFCAVSMSLAVGFAIGILVTGNNSGVYWDRSESLSMQSELTVQDGGQVLTNPLLSCGDIDSLSVGSIEELKRKVEKIIATHQSRGNTSHVSVYMRDLNNGPWFGINEKEYFYPASLLKVPLLLATYKAEEDRPGLLDRSVTFTEPLMEVAQVFEPTRRIELGKSYSIRELLRYSIVYSDNDATALLAVAVGQKYVLEVFKDFGIEVPKNDEDYLMRVRTYAAFFRVLYNASYLSRKHSEEALALLADVDFKQGLVALLPDDVTVAHKFGERESPTLGGNMQLHDCGIVYTKSPYLLCVMVQGSQAKDMISLIATVSKTIFEAVGDISTRAYFERLSILQQ